MTEYWLVPVKRKVTGWQQAFIKVEADNRVEAVTIFESEPEEVQETIVGERVNIETAELWRVDEDELGSMLYYDAQWVELE